jgi:hypothetical protein
MQAASRRSLLFLACAAAPLFHKLRQEVGKLVKPSFVSIDSYYTSSAAICVLLCLLLTRCD